MRIVNLTEETRKNILKDLLKRSPSNFGSYADTVEKIVNDVRDLSLIHISEPTRH